jgi:hypothetical protein
VVVAMAAAAAALLGRADCGLLLPLLLPVTGSA